MIWNRVANRLRAIRARRIFRQELVNAEEVWMAPRTGIKGVTLKFRDGAEIAGTALDDTAGLFHEIFAERCYAPKWFYRPEASHTVLDIGANIGVFSVFLCREASGIRVFAFEPHPKTFGLLSRNVDANRGTGNVKTQNVAVGREAGFVRFETSDTVEAGHRSASSEGKGDEVACISLVDAVAMAPANTIDLLKIDTEGAELPILSSLAPFLPAIRIVHLEFHSEPDRRAIQAMFEPTHALWAGRIVARHAGQLTFVRADIAPAVAQVGG
jgi:FkbM family methyltransferase